MNTPARPVLGKQISQGYLIKSGRVFDDGVETAADIRILGKSITQIGPDLPHQGEKVIDAAGCIVTPGLIDLHVHVYSGMGLWALDPSDCGLRTGVTTMLDTGTAGALTYPTFHRFIIPQAREDVFALINVSMIGCLTSDENAPGISDMTDEKTVYSPAVVDMIRRYPDRVLGAKVRLTDGIAGYREHVERAGLHAAVNAARETNTFCMVHHAKSLLQTPEVLGALSQGDVYTHLYHPWTTGPFTNGKPIDAALDARARGVLFDIGHGAGAFAWQIAEPAAQEHGFWPDTISSDLHSYNISGPVYDLPTTMTKILHLGMPLAKVLKAVTSSPARAMKLESRFGRLLPGRQADISILKLASGNWPLTDVLGQVRFAKERLAPQMVFKSGQLYPCVGHTAI